MAAINSVLLSLAAAKIAETKPRGRGRPRKHPPKGVYRTLLGEAMIRKRGDRKHVPRKWSDRDAEQILSLIAERRAKKSISERKALLEILREAAEEKWGAQLKLWEKRDKALSRLPAIQMLLWRYRNRNKR